MASFGLNYAQVYRRSAETSEQAVNIIEAARRHTCCTVQYSFAMADCATRRF